MGSNFLQPRKIISKFSFPSAENLYAKQQRPASIKIRYSQHKCALNVQNRMNLQTHMLYPYKQCYPHSWSHLRRTTLATSYLIIWYLHQYALSIITAGLTTHNFFAVIILASAVYNFNNLVDWLILAIHFPVGAH